MINYETVLSTFDDKLTLLQWLQKVEQALEGAGLEQVEIHQVTPTTAYFKFIFADGTSVTTPSITLPRGAKGDTGATGATGATGNGIASITKTGTSGLIDTYTILYTNGNTQTFTVTNGAQGEAGADGQDGADGVGISNVAVNADSGVLTVTLTDGNTINAGNVFTIINLGAGSSGTLSDAQYSLVDKPNCYILHGSEILRLEKVLTSAIDYLYLEPSVTIGNTAGFGIEHRIIITKATHAWSYSSSNAIAIVGSDEIISGTATNGQVLTADGNGGCSWQNAGGGGSTLYRHNIIIYEGSGTSQYYLVFNIITSSSTAFTISTLKNYILNNYPLYQNIVATGRVSATDIVIGVQNRETDIGILFFSASGGGSVLATTYDMKFSASATFTDFVETIN